jgi:hypothetical protein
MFSQKVLLLAHDAHFGQNRSQKSFYDFAKFIIDDQLISKDRVLPLLKEAEELTAIFISSRKTARQKKSSIVN